MSQPEVEEFYIEKEDEVDVLNDSHDENKENQSVCGENTVNLDVLELLIELVCKNPELYNPQDKNFKDNYLRQEKWQEISGQIKEIGLLSSKLDLDHLPYEWRKLKQRFIRALKQQNSGKVGGSSKKRSSFRYSDAMQFLIPYLTSAELEVSKPIKKEPETMEEKVESPTPPKETEILESIEPETEAPPTTSNETTCMDMETDQIGSPKAKESDQNIHESMDRIESPTLRNFNDFTLRDPSSGFQTPTLSSIKRTFDSAFNQPMVFDEEVSSIATSFGARLRTIKLHSELAYVECSKEISDIIYKYEMKRFRRDVPRNN